MVVSKSGISEIPGGHHFQVRAVSFRECISPISLGLKKLSFFHGFWGFKGGFSAREDDVCSYPVGELLVCLEDHPI